jgi:hypothetical protein
VHKVILHQPPSPQTDTGREPVHVRVCVFFFRQLTEERETSDDKFPPGVRMGTSGLVGRATRVAVPKKKQKKNAGNAVDGERLRRAGALSRFVADAGRRTDR